MKKYYLGLVSRAMTSNILDTEGIVPESYLFTKPPINLISNGNSEEITTFRCSQSGQISPASTTSITFNVNGSSIFLDPNVMYLVCTFSARDATGVIKTGAQISSAGCAALFSRVSLRINETVIEDIRSYPNHLMVSRENASNSRKAFLAGTEGFLTPGYISATGHQTFCHALELGFLRAGSKIPLSALPNGITLELFLNDPKHFFVGDGSLTYVLEKCELKALTISPNQAYAASLFSQLSKGGRLTIPYVRTRVFQSPGNNSTQCSVNTQVGAVQSLAAIKSIYQDEADIADSTKDSVVLSKNASGISQYSVVVDGQTLPSGRPFSVGLDSTNPEDIYRQAVMQEGCYTARSGGLGSFNLSTQAFSTGYCWRSSEESFGGGFDLSNSNGSVEQILQATNAISSATRITTFAWIDSLLVIIGGPYSETVVLDRYSGI